MFGKKKKNDIKDAMEDVAYKTVKNALESILKLECKLKGEDGGDDKIDYELTVRMMKSQARIALDFASNISTMNVADKKS